MSVARDDGRVVGVAAHSLYRMVLDGGQRPATFSVHATTDPVARGRGIFVGLERKHEEEAKARGAAVVLAFACAPTAPLFLGPLGWTQIGKLRIWARPLPRVALRRGRAEHVERFDVRRRRRGGVAEPHRARRRVSELALPRLAARLRRRSRARWLRGVGPQAASRPADRARRRPRRTGSAAAACRSPASSRARWPVRACRGPESAPRTRRAGSCRRRCRSTSWASRWRASSTPIRARGASRSATRTSSDAAARLRHPEVDPEHPALAATIPKIRALAAARRRGGRPCAVAATPACCRRTAEVQDVRRATRARPGACASSASSRARCRPVAVVAHMCPIYAVLAAPLARPLRDAAAALVHALEGDEDARAAERLATAVVSVDRRSFPLDSRRCVRSGTGST